MYLLIVFTCYYVLCLYSPWGLPVGTTPWGLPRGDYPGGTTIHYVCIYTLYIRYIYTIYVHIICTIYKYYIHMISMSSYFHICVQICLNIYGYEHLAIFICLRIHLNTYTYIQIHTKSYNIYINTP